jgi:peptidylprolyl isomerase
MATDPRKNPSPGNPEREKMMRVLIPAGAIILVVILVAVITSISSGSNRKMSDGSNGTENDPDLKEISAGVKYRDLKEGQGEACPEGAKVKVHYTGWLTDGTEFDSSKKRGPAEFPLDGVIAGWTQGIPKMKVGGIRKLVIAPEKAYGNNQKGLIKPGSTLIFEIELLGFIRPRRTPPPADLTKLADGSAPNEDDPNLIPIGDSGLKYRDIKVGDGPVAPAGATVVMDYSGWLKSNGSMFDSSWKPDRTPLDNPLSSLITGWQQGVPGMKVGGIRKLVIPPELGYRNDPKPGIPAGSTLVFEIELLGIK